MNENSQENDQSKALYSEKVKKPGNSIVEKSRPMAKEVNNDKSWETVKKKKKTHLGKLSGSSLKTVPRRLLPARRVARIWKRGGYFERVRSVQTTLTRIFIDLESISDGLSET